MNQNTLVIYDTDVLYAVRLQQFLCGVKDNHFQIYAFTNKEDLFKKYKDKGELKLDILLVAEKCFCKEFEELSAKHIFILNETGTKKFKEYTNFTKYQPADSLYQQILLEYADKEKEIIPRFFGNKKAKLIGVYSPIGMCMQTSFSMVSGQILGKKGRTLYINFEQYSGFSKLFQKGYLKDLSDLVYYFEYSEEKFSYWLEGVVEHFKDMDYIPPVLTASAITEISKDTWIRMLNFICEEGGYEYVILDLSDSIRGIFDVLKECHLVYTITREDVISKAKISQFKQIIESPEYKELSEKIRYINFPEFTIKNNVFENMIYRDLYEFTENLLGEVIHE